MNPARRSTATGADEGTTDPHQVRNLDALNLDGELVAVGSEWHGGGYDKDSCWILCNLDDLVPIDQ